MWQSDVEAAREAYDAFLSHYPYCYGYWRKYADYEKRKGSKKKCLEVSTHTGRTVIIYLSFVVSLLRNDIHNRCINNTWIVVLP